MLQLVGLLGIVDDKGVQVSAASNLELDVLLGLHDFDGCKRRISGPMTIK